MSKYLLLSNKSDCGDLSVYSFEAKDSEEAMLKLKRYVNGTALHGGDSIAEVSFFDNEGFIRYIDEEREDFRVVEMNKLVDLSQSDSYFDGLELEHEDRELEYITGKKMPDGSAMIRGQILSPSYKERINA